MFEKNMLWEKKQLIMLLRNQKVLCPEDFPVTENILIVKALTLETSYIMCHCYSPQQRQTDLWASCASFLLHITVMFVYIKHGENKQFLVNTNCSIICLLQYLRSKLGLTESELVDLCDETGALLFMSRHLQDYASQILTPRKTYIVCTINRSSDGAYVSITPHVANPDSALQGVLQNQSVSLEQTRRKNLHALEGRKTSVQTLAQKQPVRPHNPASR